ncbi:uncharacterized protein LOC119112690 [Pollicipes pollicipes]|uniref:uncharacterized protein LOC119112690 n=1 Tax=Pollicipes pollicipes TaxID=41117 RepID=UPI001884B9CA|nr:uncharacterized protein LOC119112690 [Pollicipes pollicipes]
MNSLLLSGGAAFNRDLDKVLEACSTKANGSYSDRICAVISAWQQVAELQLPSPPPTDDSFLEPLHRLTLELLLHGEWAELPAGRQTELTDALGRAEAALQLPTLQPVWRQLQTLAAGPWDQPVLRQLISKQHVTDQQAMEFCCSESPDLLTLRLQTLCESRCEDLALALVRHCYRCQEMADGKFKDMCSSIHKLLFLDLYITLLFKWRKKDAIISMLSSLQGAAAVSLVRRFVARRGCRQRMWRHAARLAAFLSQLLLVHALFRPGDDHCVLELTVEWAQLLRQGETAAEPADVEASARTLVSKVDSARHIIAFAHGLSLVLGAALRPLAIELCVRALTLETNRLEHLKLADEAGGGARDDGAPQCVGDGVESGPGEPDAAFLACADGLISQLQSAAARSTRWKRLSWTLDWRRLHALCRAYLHDPDRLMNITRDLRYLDIDYSRFGGCPKSEPPDAFHGIEKGYERFLKGCSRAVSSYVSHNPAAKRAALDVKLSRKQLPKGRNGLPQPPAERSVKAESNGALPPETDAKECASGRQAKYTPPDEPPLAEQLREFESVLEAVWTGQERAEPELEDERTRGRIVAILRQYRRH